MKKKPKKNQVIRRKRKRMIRTIRIRRKHCRRKKIRRVKRILIEKAKININQIKRY